MLVQNCVQKWLFASGLVPWHLEKRIRFCFAASGLHTLWWLALKLLVKAATL
jgi:hypothetical protein